MAAVAQLLKLAFKCSFDACGSEKWHFPLRCEASVFNGNEAEEQVKRGWPHLLPYSFSLQRLLVQGSHRATCSQILELCCNIEMSDTCL